MTVYFTDMDGGPEMAVIPAGEFLMGSPSDEPGRNGREGPPRKVVIPAPFAIGRFAVTCGEFEAFLADNSHYMSGGADMFLEGEGWKFNPMASFRDPGFDQDADHPVTCVNWRDAKSYALWLSRKTGKDYRLPTEAEWEYAARAGTATPFWWGDTILPDQANYCTDQPYPNGGKTGKWRRKTVPVNAFQPNPWGLWQVHGNVWEWTEDRWRLPGENASADCPEDGALHVIRGGSWLSHPQSVRSAARDGGEFRDFNTGFRLARSL